VIKALKSAQKHLQVAVLSGGSVGETQRLSPTRGVSRAMEAVPHKQAPRPTGLPRSLQAPRTQLQGFPALALSLTHNQTGRHFTARGTTTRRNLPR